MNSRRYIIFLCCKTHTYRHLAKRVTKDGCKTCVSVRFLLYLLEELERVAWVDTMVNFHLILLVTKRQFYTEVILEMHLKGTHRTHPGSWHFWRLLSRAVSLTFSVLYFTGHRLQMVLWYLVVGAFVSLWVEHLLNFISLFHVCNNWNNVSFLYNSSSGRFWIFVSGVSSIINPTIGSLFNYVSSSAAWLTFCKTCLVSIFL